MTKDLKYLMTFRAFPGTFHSLLKVPHAMHATTTWFTIHRSEILVSALSQAKKAASLDYVVVATDDERIAEVCRRAGAKVVMTSPVCPNGEL